MTDKKKIALHEIELCITELDKNNGSVAIAITKLLRVSQLLGDNKLEIWCQIQLGYSDIQHDVSKILSSYAQYGILDKRFINLVKEIELSTDIDFTFHLLGNLKYLSDDQYGGVKGVKYIEDMYLQLKNDKQRRFFSDDYKEHLECLRALTLKHVNSIYDSLKFSGTTQNSFEILKTLIDDKLLDLEPELTEQLMLSFKSASSENKEEWSQAAVTCRRLFEKLADRLYPAREEKVKGREVKQHNYINRIWMFMDEAISSDTSKELAKSHVVLIGSLMQRIYKLANKGTHEVKGEITQIEVVKMVFHTYLMLADLLEYLDQSNFKKIEKLSISKASLDDLEVVLGISNIVAKDIIRERVKNGGELSFEQLSKVKGIGQKTIDMAKENFSE